MPLNVLGRTRATLTCSSRLLPRPIGEPTQELIDGARARGIEIVCGNVELLGGMIGHNDDEFDSFLQEELASYEPLLQAIRDPSLPAALALYFGRVCALPKPIYLMRNLPLRITQRRLPSFVAQLRSAVLARLDTPSPLPDTASFTFHQPIGKGGLGFVESTLVVPAARWACLALAASEVQDLIDTGVDCALVRDRVDTFRALVNAGIAVTDSADQGCAPDDDSWQLLPYSPAHLHTHYLGVDGQSMHHLQKRLTSDLLAEQRRVWMSSCQEDDFTRVQSCSLKGVSEWLTDVRASLCMSDTSGIMMWRLR